ncbi:MAG: hypothetical protein ACFE9L_16485 [Candidatus Hodarchaeota archaeon]
MRLRTLQLGNDIYDWYGASEVLTTSLYKINLVEPVKIMKVITDSSKEGIVILGRIEAIVDSIIYTSSHGAVGNITTFSGTNLVVLGLSIAQLNHSIKKSILIDSEVFRLKHEAQSMISKLKKRIEDPYSSLNIDFDDDGESDFIIFGRRNFLLIGGDNNFVLIHKKQIIVRKGDQKLVQVDSKDGILVAENEKVLQIGGSARHKLGSLLGEFGVNIASSVLDQILWD